MRAEAPEHVCGEFTLTKTLIVAYYSHGLSVVNHHPNQGGMTEEKDEKTSHEHQLDLVHSIHDNAQKKYELHSRSAKFYGRFLYSIQGGIIVLSAVSGIISLNTSTQTLSPKKSSELFIVFGVIQVFTSLMSTLKSTFRPGEVRELHKLVSNLYNKMIWDLKGELSLIGTEERTYRDISELVKTKLSWLYQLREIEPGIPDLVITPFWKFLICMCNNKQKSEEENRRKNYKNEIDDLNTKISTPTPPQMV